MIEPRDFHENEESPFRDVGVEYLGYVDNRVKEKVEEAVDDIKTEEPILCHVALEKQKHMVRIKAQNEVTDRVNRVAIQHYEVVSGRDDYLKTTIESVISPLTKVKYE